MADQKVIKEGFLTKKGNGMLGKWKERWFVLKGSALFYYKEPRVRSKSISFSFFIFFFF
jgi:hypothetical protein